MLGYISCDSAVYYDKLRRWVLRGRVRIRTAQGVEYASQQLYWDEAEHQLYSHVFSHIKTPDRELQGSYFRSDETMTEYEIGDAKGWGLFDKADMAPSAGRREGTPIPPGPPAAAQPVADGRPTVADRRQP